MGAWRCRGLPSESARLEAAAPHRSSASTPVGRPRRAANGSRLQAARRPTEPSPRVTLDVTAPRPRAMRHCLGDLRVTPCETALVERFLQVARLGPRRDARMTLT